MINKTLNLSLIDYTSLNQCQEIIYNQPSLWFIAIPLFIGLILSVMLFIDIYFLRKKEVQLNKKLNVLEWFAWIIFLVFLALSLILSYFFL